MSSEKEIIYRLKLISDPDNEKIAKEFADKQQQADRLANNNRKRARAEDTKEEIKTGKDSLDRIANNFNKRQQIIDKFYKDQQRLSKAASREEEKDQKETLRAYQTAAKEKARIQKEEERSRNKSLRDEMRARDQAASAHTSALGRIRAGQSMMVEGITSGTEGVMRLARGFVLLGVSGEKDLQKVIRALTTIQGVFDVVVGGVRVYYSLSKAVEGYRMAVQAAAVAETTLAAARARSAAAGGAGSAVAGNLGGASMLARLGPAGIIGGYALGLGALGAVASNPASYNRAVDMFGGSGDILGSGRGGVMGGIRQGLLGASGASWLLRPFAENMDAEKGAQERARNISELDFRREQEAMLRGRDSDLFSLRLRGMSSSGMFFRPEDRLAAIRSDQSATAGLSSAQRGLLSTSRDNPIQEAGARNDLLASLEKEHDLATDRLSVEKDIAETKKKAAENAISDAERELSIVKRKISEEQNRLMTAQERFGRLNPLEQSRTIRLAQQARTRGFGSLRADELESLERNVGTAFFGEGAQAEFRRRADDRLSGFGGFGAFAGDVENRRIGSLTSEQKALEVKITNQQQIAVNVQQDFDRLAAEIARQVAGLVAEQSSLLQQKVQQEFERQSRNLANSRNSVQPRI